MTSRPAAALAAVAALALLPSTALAASPAKGTISEAQPRVEWSGDSAGTVLQYGHFFFGGQIVDDCFAPVCDSFTLTLAAPGNLEISAEDASGYTEVQIKDAQGNEIFWSGGDDGVPTVYTEFDAQPGTYTVEVLTDALAPEVDDTSYSAFARFFEDEPVEEEPPFGE